MNSVMLLAEMGTQSEKEKTEHVKLHGVVWKKLKASGVQEFQELLGEILPSLSSVQS